MTHCTRCQQTGFLNTHQIPEDVFKNYDETGDQTLLESWMNENKDHDVQWCDCCDGSGEHDRSVEKFFDCM